MVRFKTILCSLLLDVLLFAHVPNGKNQEISVYKDEILMRLFHYSDVSILQQTEGCDNCDNIEMMIVLYTSTAETIALRRICLHCSGEQGSRKTKHCWTFTILFKALSAGFVSQYTFDSGF